MPVNLGETIYTLRTAKGLSQLELAEALDVSRQSISKWETGAAVPELDKLLSMSKYFGVPVGALLGAEEDANEAQCAEDKLTPQQVRMVQEIADRYISALPRAEEKTPKRWPRVLAVIAAIALLAGLRSMSKRLTNLNDRYNDLYYRIEAVNQSIYGVTGRVEQLLREQNSLMADYTAEVKSADIGAGTADIEFRAVPRTFVEGMQAWIEVENEGEKQTFGPYLPQEQTFRGLITTALTDDIKVYVVFEDGDKRETQLLQTFDSLYRLSSPDVMLMGFAATGKARFDRDGRVILDENDTTLVELFYEDSQAVVTQARMRKAQVGLFRNRRLVAWAQEQEVNVDYFGHRHNADHHHYVLPETHVACESGDELAYAALVTDEYGREFLFQGAPSVMQPDGTFDGPGTYNMLVDDYSDWVFTPEA